METAREKYLISVTSWESCAKKKIRYMFMTEGKESARDDATAENLLYLYIRDPARTEPAQREVSQITPVESQNHQAAQQATAVYNGTSKRPYNVPERENPSLFRLIQGRNLREARMIIEIRDENGNRQKTTRTY